MKLDNYHSVYFLGIGGIGMSALARWFMKKGVQVYGYDKTTTTLIQSLKEEGAFIHFDDAVENIPSVIKNNKETTLVIFTPAIPKDHVEHAYFKNNNYTILKRSEVLGLLTKNYRTVAVAGTHGKTTTSSMIAHILKVADKNMVAFLGGITTNYNSNLVMNGAVNNDTLVVVEADEFDRSFLKLYPEVAVITSADPDHLDIYENHDNLIISFQDFIKQIDKDGQLIIHESIQDKLTTGIEIPVKTNYSISRGNFFAENITAKNGFFEFDLHGFDKPQHVTLGIPGFHNVENAIAASIAAHKVGVDISVVKKALASFTGVKRRFEFVLKGSNVLFVDDYAHHPTEIEAFLRSLKSMYPRKKLTVIFQPHLFTRTRDFAKGFSETLSLADELFLMDIYPARELAIPGVDSDMIFKDITSKHKIRCNKENLIEVLQQTDLELIATVGAGDIDTFVEPIKKMLIGRYEN